MDQWGPNNYIGIYTLTSEVQLLKHKTQLVNTVDIESVNKKRTALNCILYGYCGRK